MNMCQQMGLPLHGGVKLNYREILQSRYAKWLRGATADGTPEELAVRLELERKRERKTKAPRHRWWGKLL
jgi:hypothetical protein